MNKVFHMIASGIAGIGLADGLAAIYQTNPPVRMPKVMTAQEAMAADASALLSNFSRVYGDIYSAYVKEVEVVHAQQ